MKTNDIGIEVVSGHEYKLAKSNLNTNRIIFNGPQKTDIEITKALNENATVHLDTWNQVKQIIKIKQSGFIRNNKIKLGIRLKTHPNSRFGYDINNGEADQIIKELNDQNLSISSLHHHPGTDIYSTNWRYQGASKLSNRNNFV